MGPQPKRCVMNLRDSNKSSQNNKFVCKRQAVSLSLSLYFYDLLSKFANSLDPEIARCFAGPVQGQTSIPNSLSSKCMSEFASDGQLFLTE